MFPWEPACQSSSLDSPVIKIKCERTNGYTASRGRAKMLSGCILYPKYASLCKEEVFSQLFQMGLLFFWITFAGSVVSSHTELGADCKRTPCSSAVAVCRLHTTLAPQAPWHSFFLPACGCTEPVLFITPLRPFLQSFRSVSAPQFVQVYRRVYL